MSFPPGTEMFQFPGFASLPYVFRQRYRRNGGLPHSEIHGSKLVRSSPWLIAAYHVLHRLCAPRHPPDALMSLDCSHHQCPILRGRKSTLSFCLYQCPSLRTDTDVKTKFHRDRPNSRSGLDSADRVGRSFSNKDTSVLAARESLRSIPSSRCKR
jgi:hypothetical protein